LANHAGTFHSRLTILQAGQRLAGLSGAMELAETQPEKKAPHRKLFLWPPN